jgi:muramoyltetrapeptide carboxypeptidase LdcA involved in peptidoglycan recycling
VLISKYASTNWQQQIPLVANPGWQWINADHVNEVYAGAILLLETSEEQPDAEYVYRVLVGMGERGMLAQFAAVLVGRPKAWEINKPRTPEQKTAYMRTQRAAIQRALDEYAPGMLAVYNLDFGHTDPQWVVPLGATLRIDGMQHRIFAHY